MTDRPLTWPSRERLATGITGALVVSLAFFPIYVGGATMAGLRGQALHLYAGWELATPFWPPMIVGYLSMFALFVIPPFQLEPRELADLARRLVVASLIGGLVLFGLPSELGFGERRDAGLWQPLYDRLYAIDGRFNAVPSFHVIYTASILLALVDVSTPRLRIAWAAWLAIVCASTVLTHRHHLIDVASGLAVAFAVRALARVRKQTRSPSPEASQPIETLMRSIALSIALIALLGASISRAQDAGQVADHEALRQLKADVVDAINTQNFSAMDTLLHKPFFVTVITQDSFDSIDALKAYFQGLFTRSFLRINRIQMQADADELSQIYTGTFAVARGTTMERYELADGRGFDIPGRWTATAVKENGKWTVLAIHDGANFLDNPVIDAIERHSVTLAAGGAAVGAVVGFLLGFFVRRRRAKVA